MGFYSLLKGDNKEQEHKEYLELRERLIKAQMPVKPKQIRKTRQPRAGKVTTYNINDLKNDNEF